MAEILRQHRELWQEQLRVRDFFATPTLGVIFEAQSQAR